MLFSARALTWLMLRPRMWADEEFAAETTSGSPLPHHAPANMRACITALSMVTFSTQPWSPAWMAKPRLQSFITTLLMTTSRTFPDE